VNQSIRLGTNVVLARLLTPELFGTMLIVDTLRIGVELISDVGISQNIIYHRNANDPDFYNTAWSVQLIRSIILWLVFLAAAVPIARFYDNPIFTSILPITAFNFLITGFASIKRPLLQKRLKVAKLNVFDMTLTCISSASFILFAYLSPTIWALVFGGFIPTLASTIGSYFLISGVKQRFHISKEAVWQILGFGKWIFVSSIVFFLSMNYDRLYLAKIIPLELVGVYGISRAISDVASNFVARLAAIVIFPFISSHADTPRADLRRQIASIRARFLMAAALGFSLFVATADLVIKVLYDKRYEDATWVLPALLIGTWFSILANLSESTLLGLGKPAYGAISSGFRFGFLLIGFWFAGRTYGLMGCVIVIAVSDLCRYLPSLIGQKRERFWFGSQDLLITLGAFLMTALLEWLRWLYGFGTSFDSMPLIRNYF
jgi:O-antigen/teichoic acid export membrane protein